MTACIIFACQSRDREGGVYRRGREAYRFLTVGALIARSTVAGLRQMGTIVHRNSRGRPMKLTEEKIGDYIAQSASIIFTLENEIERIQLIAGMIVECLKNGGKLVTCGNGGSAAEAMHLAEELTGKYNKNRRALPAICLCSDASAMTCIANDWDFTYVFSRQVEAFAQKGDVLVMFTTSGNSLNCLRPPRR